MSWTDERIETLKTMWEAGQTASQIAEALGGVSRNAVIGKAHRLELQARPSPVKANEPEPVAPAPVPEVTAAPEPEMEPEVAAAPAAPEIEAEVAALGAQLVHKPVRPAQLRALLTYLLA